MVNALVSVDGVELVGELQLTTLEYLELKKISRILEHTKTVRISNYALPRRTALW